MKENLASKEIRGLLVRPERVMLVPKEYKVLLARLGQMVSRVVKVLLVIRGWLDPLARRDRKVLLGMLVLLAWMVRRDHKERLELPGRLDQMGCRALRDLLVRLVLVMMELKEVLVRKV